MFSGSYRGSEMAASLKNVRLPLSLCDDGPEDLQPLQHKQLKFLTGSEQQLGDVETNLVQEMREEKTMPGSEDSSQAVKCYLQRTGLYLKKEVYSCGAYYYQLDIKK